MLFDALPVSFALSLLLCVDHTLATPAPHARSSSSSRGLHIPILRRAPPQRSDDELGLWAKRQKQLLEAKYSRHLSTTPKRSTGYNLCAHVSLSFITYRNGPGLSTKTSTLGTMTHVHMPSASPDRICAATTAQ